MAGHLNRWKFRPVDAPPNPRRATELFELCPLGSGKANRAHLYTLRFGQGLSPLAPVIWWSGHLVEQSSKQFVIAQFFLGQKLLLTSDFALALRNPNGH